MTSLPYPFTTSTATTTTTNISALSPSPSFRRVSHVPIVRNRNHRFAPSKVTYNSTNGDPNSDSTSDIRETSPWKLDRRNVLLGIGGLYGAAGGLGATEPLLAFEAPIQVGRCYFATPPTGVTLTNCCPPATNKKIIDFQPPSPKSGYQYQDIPIPWLKKSTMAKAKTTSKSSKSGVAKAAELPKTTISSIGDFPKALNSVIRVEVPRPKKSRSKKEKEDEEEVLLIKGIELERDNFVKFDVYINDEDYSVSKPSNSEFAGSFVKVQHKHMKGMKTKTSLRLAMNELLEDLGAEDDESVIVTIVPRVGTDDVSIGGIEIEFVSD